MKRKDHLNKYGGPLSPAQAAQGIQEASRNAMALLEDADILYRNERWARAAALAILSIEESGKVPILRALLLAKSQKELQDGWRQYRTHTRKNRDYILPDLVAKGARTLEDLRPIHDENSEHPYILDALKQVCFYTEAYGKCHWSSPREVIGKDVAQSFLTLARLLSKKLPGAFTMEPELKIWFKNMGPVWKRSMNEMKAALLACYSEAREAGVLQGQQDTPSLDDFPFGSRKFGAN